MPQMAPIIRMSARPTRTHLALIALWAAWLLNAVALFVNQFVFDGSGIGPGLTLGIVALTAQSVMLVFVARGSSVARALAVVFAVLAVPPLQMIPRLLVDRSLFSATHTALSFVLKASGTILLF
jgi:hypothetical protein